MSRHNLFTSNFKEIGKFIIKCFLFLGIVVAFLLYLSPQYLGNYQASLIDKVERLESIEGPKIVLIGDSNLAFGIDSEKIEETFGMPVVNMGLHGGLGNVFHEEMAKLNVDEGDLYIVCHCRYSDDDRIENEDLAWITIEDHPRLWQILRTEDYLPMFEAYPVYLKKCIALWLEDSGNQMDKGVYSRKAFNEYGDIEWRDRGQEYIFKDGDIFVPLISDNVCERLNELNGYLEERGATLLIAGYPITLIDSTPSADLYVEFQNELEEKLDAPVISNYTDYFFPEGYFLNTEYHLNNIGKRARTNQLIADIERYFEELNE
ncbi:MAG: RuvX/YqgF family protein [Lachnospiraceae bacterium]|nr:RuvX/YqgF family protein [Lachnospiraceae bacterium]